MTPPGPSPADVWRARHALWAVLAGLLASVTGYLVVRSGGVTGLELFAVVLPLQSVGTIAAGLLMARRRGPVVPLLALRARWADLLGVLVGAGIQIVLSGVAVVVVEVLFGGEVPGTQEVVTEAASVEGWPAWAAVVAGVVILGPIAEEIAFRGILLPALLRRGERFAVWVSAGLFAALHLVDPNAAFSVPFLFVLAVILGNEVMRTGRLGRPVAIHAGFNLVTVFALIGAA